MEASNITPPLCANGYGFFGTTEKLNMCFKCYNDYLKQELIDKSSFNFNTKSITPTHDDDQSLLSIKNQPVIVDYVDHHDDKFSSFVKNRCRSYNKKVGFIGFSCRCGAVFYGRHRFADEHSCTFDFNKANCQLLVKQNLLVKVDKLYHRI